MTDINKLGELKKTVNLHPFNLDKDNSDPLFVPTDANDIIYGGLGGDFLHGGAGDDAISGAEALPEFYDNPQPQQNVLRHGEVRAGEFAAYDEYNPRLWVMVDKDGVFIDINDTTTPALEFLLNFDHEDDPEDHRRALRTDR